MALALPAKNLAIAAEDKDIQQICAPCASCYSRLRSAQLKLQDEKVRSQIEDVIEAKVPDGLEVVHALDMIVDAIGIEAVEQKVTRSLGGLKTACYYGCLMTRPPKVTDKKDFENPLQMEDVLEAVGAECADWNLKTFCCGASFALTETDVVLDLTKKILDDALASGAEVIAVGCPLCHANLDGRQEQINEKYGTNFNVPIFYFTEMLGLAMGVSAKEMGVLKHLTETEDFLKERALL
jgi:heterodisulfide reductase subunit B